jgi:hypothetical protein
VQFGVENLIHGVNGVEKWARSRDFAFGSRFVTTYHDPTCYECFFSLSKSLFYEIRLQLILRPKYPKLLQQPLYHQYALNDPDQSTDPNFYSNDINKTDGLTFRTLSLKVTNVAEAGNPP